jgi:hypothetical protein
MAKKPPLPLEHPEAWKAEPAGPLRDALRLAREGEKRRPTLADHPPMRTFPGRKPELISGQLSLDGDDEAA